MKIPMKWLREYVDVNMAPQEYASRMIMTGTAVEGVDKTGEQFDGVVVGRVLTCEDHPNSDHLHVCTVDVGGEAPLKIVCWCRWRWKARVCRAAGSSAASCAAWRVRA